jgi:tRNA-splicing ligase RtcB (3'-phosphate/5'-hydroxy nucleic acid ligase)
MQFIDGIAVWVAPDHSAVSQIKTCARTADRVALMADHHKGDAVPIGAVVANHDAISPSEVGYDIACGNKAVRVDMPGEALRANIRRVMDDVWNTVILQHGARRGTGDGPNRSQRQSRSQNR